MAITINGSGITSANIADGTIVNADVNDVAASKLTGALPAISGASLTNLPGGGAMELISSVNVTSSVTSVEFTGLSGYTKFKFIGSRLSVATSWGYDMSFNLSSDNGTTYYNTAGDYFTSGNKDTSSGGSSNSSRETKTYGLITDGGCAGDLQDQRSNLCFEATLFVGDGTRNTKMLSSATHEFSDSGRPQSLMSANLCTALTNASSVDAIKFWFNGGLKDIATGGIFSLYGIKDS